MPKLIYTHTTSKYHGQGPAAMEHRCSLPAQHQRQQHFTAFSPVRSAKKRVKFSPMVAVKPYSRASDMTKETKSKLYYNKRELEEFRARATCTGIRNSGTLLEVAKDSMIGLDADVKDDADTDSLRGLEMCMYPKRRRNKVLARRSLLNFQTVLRSKPKSHMTDEQKRLALAVAGAKLNLWSSLVARETARLDELRAYGSVETAALVSPPVSPPPSPPLFGTGKRRKQLRMVTESTVVYGTDSPRTNNKRRKTDQYRE